MTTDTLDPSRRPATVASALVGAAALVVIVAGLRQASTLVLPFLMAFFLAVLSLPLMVWLQSKRLPVWAAVLLTLVAVLGAAGAILLLVSGSVVGFIERMPQYQERLESLHAGVLQWLDRLGARTDAFDLKEHLTPAHVFDFVGVALSSAALILSNILLVLLTLVFLLFEAGRFRDKLARAFPQGDGTSERFGRIVGDIQTYFKVKVVVSFATGVLAGLWAWILGIDFPLLWGLVAFLLNFIPNLGSILAAVPPALLALVQHGPGTALLAILGYVAINVGIGTGIEPRWMGKRMGLSTLVVFLSLVFWGWVWGPIGMLLSVPLTMFVKILLEHSERNRWVAVMLEP